MKVESVVPFGTFIRSLSREDALNFSSDIKVAIEHFFLMGAVKSMSDNDLLNYLIQATRGRYGSCQDVTTASKFLDKAVQKYSPGVKIRDASIMLKWVKYIDAGYNADNVIGYYFDKYRITLLKS